jgi:small-conductance mechanosensitive channel
MDINSLVYGLIIIGFGLVLGLILFRITKTLTKSFANEARGKSLGRVVQWLTVIVFAMIGGVVIFGANPNAVALVLGALTFALTFGLQNVIQNFVAGLLIAIDGRLQIGQWVEVGDRPWQTGPAEVLDISLQKVKLRESGGKIYFVPNSYIFMHKLLNFSENGYVEVQVPLTLPYHKDSERAKLILMNVAKAGSNIFPKSRRPQNEMVRAPSKIERMGGAVVSELPEERMLPTVRLVRMTQDGVDYLVTMWTPFPELQSEITSDYLRRSIEALELANIKQKVDMPGGATIISRS